MASGTGSHSFVRAWHFVDSADKDSKTTRRLHAVREAARRRKWQDEQERLKAGKGSIVQVNPLPSRRPRKLSSGRRSQACDSDSESDNDGPSAAESSDMSDTTPLSQMKLEGYKWLVFRSRRQPLRPIKGNQHLQKPTQSTVLSPSPHFMLGSARGNPFDTYPISNPGQKLDILTHSFLSMVTSVTMGVSPDAKFNPIRDIQLALSVEDPASFHAFIAMSACGVDRCCGRPPGADAISHKLEAIRLINDRLESGNISNPTIQAVALLWMLEAHFDDEEKLQAHINGLQQMIVRRGGFPSLSPSLQLNLIWILATLPGRFTLPVYKEHSDVPEASTLSTGAYVSRCWTSLFSLLHSINSLSRKPSSPYPLHSPFFAPNNPLHRLLSARTAAVAHVRYNAMVNALCRLGCLICIHETYVEYQASSRDLSLRLLSLSSRLLKHSFHRQGTVILLAGLFSTEEKENEGGNGCWVDDRAWQATRILSVAKVLSLETLHELGDLLFGYLVVGFDLDTTAVTATTEMETKVQQLHERYLSVVGSIMSEIDQSLEA